MRSIAWLAVPFVLAAAACGGDSKLPTAPSVMTPGASQALTAVRDSSSPAEIPFTIETIAPSLASEINVSFINAMEAGLPATATATGRRFQDLLRDAINSVLGVRVQAQQGFTANCSRRGSVNVRYFGATQGRRATLGSTPVSFLGCTFRAGSRDVTFSAELKADGVYTAGQPTSPVRLTGDINVEGLAPIQIDATTGVYLKGALGGEIRIGAPDTPPPPTPETPPIGTLINITGTWGADGQPVFSFEQYGSVFKGRLALQSLPPSGGIFIERNDLWGTISGNEVTLTGILVMRVGDPSGWQTTTIQSTGTLRLTGGTLSGTVLAQFSSECTGDAECLPPFEDSAPMALARMAAPAPATATLLDVSGSWMETGTGFVYELTQNNGVISGRITGSHVVEGSIAGGRNVDNQVTLTAHVKWDISDGHWTHTVTWDKNFDMSVVDPSAIMGIENNTYVEKCVELSPTARVNRWCRDLNKTERQTNKAWFMRK